MYFWEVSYYVVPVALLLGLFLITIYGLKEAKSCELWDKHTRLGLSDIVACCFHVIIFRQDKMYPWLSDFSCKEFLTL